MHDKFWSHDYWLGFSRMCDALMSVVARTSRIFSIPYRTRIDQWSTCARPNIAIDGAAWKRPKKSASQQNSISSWSPIAEEPNQKSPRRYSRVSVLRGQWR